MTHRERNCNTDPFRTKEHCNEHVMYCTACQQREIMLYFINFNSHEKRVGYIYDVTLFNGGIKQLWCESVLWLVCVIR